MGQDLECNLDERVVELLKSKAELKGRSLEQELREILTAAAPLTAEEKVALSRHLQSLSPPLRDIDVPAAGRDDEHQ